MFAVYLNIIVWLVVKEYETYSALVKVTNEILPVRASFNSVDKFTKIVIDFRCRKTIIEP